MARKTRKAKATRTTDLPLATVKKSSDEFNPDYSYVVENLKRIGILAVIFIAGLVVLSFIL
ncbi:MAG: hypothetical protein GX933_07125 [Chloroflexi bacterium]|jgi:hypothetical protein|nr:hypothetical protein [Chloroflexota bacterium]